MGPGLATKLAFSETPAFCTDLGLSYLNNTSDCNWENRPNIFSDGSCWEIIIIKQIHTFTSNILIEQRRFGLGLFIY